MAVAPPGGERFLILPEDVTAAGRSLGRRAGIDPEDGISHALESWWKDPDGPWRTVTWCRCVDERRRVSGRGKGPDRRALLIMDAQPPEGSGRALLDHHGVEEAGFREVERKVDLAAALGDLPDEDLARLARAYWLGMTWEEAGGDTAVMRSVRRARLGVNLPMPERSRVVPLRVPRHPESPEPSEDAQSPPAAPQPCPFSRRELEVVEALSHGLTNVQIGRRLSIQANTVKSHLMKMSKAASTNDRTHLVALALRAGWIA